MKHSEGTFSWNNWLAWRLARSIMLFNYLNLNHHFCERDKYRRDRNRSA